MADHNGEALSPITLNTVTAAKKVGGEITALVCGEDCTKVTSELASVEGITKLLVAQNAAFKGFLPEALTPVILAAQEQFKFSHIFSGASAVGKVRLQPY